MASPMSSASASFVRSLQDPAGLRSVLATQASEALHLRQRFLAAQGECALLQQKQRDCESELHVAAQATATATERLGAHAVRHGLVLAAGVERCGAERAALEDELQRMERLLCERDQEIARLRSASRELEASQLQGSLEMRGLAVAQEAASAEARKLDYSISELMSRSGHGGTALGPSPAVQRLLQEAEQRLASKAQEHGALSQRADAAAEEARALEAEETGMVQRVADYDRALREQRRQMEAEDQRHAREGELLREQTAELRRMLEREQWDTVGVDQRASLEFHTAAEAEKVRLEVAEIKAVMPKLAGRLYQGGRHVHSLMVPGDAVDESLHDYLRTCSSHGLPTPALVCRLGPNEYLLDGLPVTLSLAHKQVMVAEAGYGAAVSLPDFLRKTAPALVRHHPGAKAAPAPRVQGPPRPPDGAVIF